MINIEDMVNTEIENGYGSVNAAAKVCQDIILKAISIGSLNRNITVKGGVVMRSKTANVRRATQDLDLDFIRYSLSDESIDAFVNKLDSFNDVSIRRVGEIEELKQQDYKGKRIYVAIEDSEGNVLTSKIDLGVHNRLDIEQEEYCFDIAWDEEGASLLINSSEQMFAEKLRSLLRFGAVSTRYKDIFDMFYLSSKLDKNILLRCLDIYIFSDQNMRETSINDIVRRLNMAFNNRSFRNRAENSDKRWLDEDIDAVFDEIIATIQRLS